MFKPCHFSFVFIFEFWYLIDVFAFQAIQPNNFPFSWLQHGRKETTTNGTKTKTIGIV